MTNELGDVRLAGEWYNALSYRDKDIVDFRT